MKKHTKRFMVIFSVWGQKPLPLRDRRYDNEDSYTYARNEVEFDTEEEWKEEVNLIEKFYASTPHPKRSGTDSNYPWEFTSEDERLWGYMVLDFEKSKVLKIGGDGIDTYRKTNTRNKISLKLLDELFRRDDEIPKNYVFDYGEYDGWLQFRWGDGKNAIKKGPRH